MIRKISVIFLTSLFSGLLFAQQVNIENVLGAGQNRPITLNGGLSVGGIHFTGNETFAGRQPWTYYLNGNLNMNLYGLVNIPINIHLTNLGMDLAYPQLPNRLSLHPSYKWATAHIGDVAMTFSPYTLNGHLFTGGGVDLTPGNFRISLMGGRLMREVPHSVDEFFLLPNYERWGYGANVQYNGARYSVGMIYFWGRDNVNESMMLALDSLDIFPMQNSVFSWNIGIRLVQNLTFTAEYAVSILTHDTRAVLKDNNFIDNILNRKTSTDTYNAFNARLTYQLRRNTIGIGYERIDPLYQTLGAYFFNNDFENITLNFARPFLREDRANIAVSFGVQRDNLDRAKDETSNRYVGSINLNYNPTENLQFGFNFSTFQSYRHIRSQFDFINEMSPYENLDTLSFTQLSQNLDASVMYTFQQSETRSQRLNLLVSYQEAADRQGGISLPGNVSRFANTALGYSLTLIPQNINITASINGTYNYTNFFTSYIVGPMAGITASFFDRALSGGFSTAYNVNIIDGKVQAKVWNCRANITYRFRKRHNLNANILWQNRNLPTRTTHNITTTVSYSYSF